GDQRVTLAAGLLRGLDAVGIALLVLEAEHVHRAQGGTDLGARALVQERGQPRARADRAVVAALRADLEVLLELRPVQHRSALVAFFPQTLGHAALAAGGRFGADARGHQFLQPAHARQSNPPGPPKAARNGERKAEARSAAAPGPSTPAMACTSALPTTTPSACAARAEAVAASLMPNPAITGRLLCPRTQARRSPTAPASPTSAPVTPARLT